MKIITESKSRYSIGWILVAASLLWMGSMLAGCGRSNNSESGNPASMPMAPSSQTLPRQNMIVRVHQNSGRAEYAAANFDPNGNRQQLPGIAQDQKLQWTPVNEQSVINQQRGYPQATDNQFYFVQNPRDFRAAQQPPANGSVSGQGQSQTGNQTLPTFIDNSNRLVVQNFYGNNFGYFNYPYYDGSFYYGNQRFLHNYPVNPYAFYNNYAYFNYQPVFYYNYGYNYFTPCYYYSAPNYGYSYYYYSYWW